MLLDLKGESKETGDGPVFVQRQIGQESKVFAIGVHGADHDFVAEDEFETKGARALLNLGHTFGHALEAQTGFSDRLLHGEAVAMGMVLAARYSARIGLLPRASAEHVARHIVEAGLPSEISSLGLNCDGAALTAHMLHDKKMDAGTLPFVLMKGIGEAFLARDVDLADVAVFLDAEMGS